MTLTVATATRRAAEIHFLAQVGTLQVRWHKGRLMTFRFPAPRGYGVRGELVAVYGDTAPLEWIADDLTEFALSLTSDTCEQICIEVPRQFLTPEGSPVSESLANHAPRAHIPAAMNIRPLRDQIIVEPLRTVLSKVVLTIEKTLPLRGIVKAVGPGCYPKRYDHPDKHKRSKMWDSEVFEPTTVKVGDVVELAGHEFGGYSFPQIQWGDQMHIICRELDVSGVVDGLTAEQAREEAEGLTA